jgi:hypothetical protein
MLATSLHLLVGLLGFSLLYAALFLHENEEGHLQNRLEKLWIAVDDLSKVALSKQTAFLQQVSAMANSALNRLFGKRLFSAAAVSASLCLSLGTAALSVIWVQRFVGDKIGPQVDFYLLVIGVISLLIGLTPTPFRYLGFIWVFGLAFLMLHHDRKIVSAEGWGEFVMREAAPFAAVLAGGLLSDILFIALSRWCLRKSSELKNGWQIAGLVTLNGGVGLTLISPVILGIINPVMRDHAIARIGDSVYFCIFLIGTSNLVTGAIALLFVVLAFAALAHLAIWPILERPIYSLQRFGVARQPKLLAAVSVTCLLFAWPKSPIILAIIKLIHGG